LCIIVVKPLGKKLDKSVMKTCWERNNDGAGFMYSLDGKIIINKELKSFDKIWNKYHKCVIKPKLEENKIVVFHFRIQTHGNIDEENCHPFYINSGRHMAFCHNGVIRNVSAGKDDHKSDTIQFKDKVLDHLPKNWMDNPGIMQLMINYIDYNKLAFLNSSGDVLIFNKSKGDEDENGIWYSNSTYKEIKIHNTTVISSKTDHKPYNVHDKRNNWHGRKNWRSGKRYENDYYDCWDEDLGDYGLSLEETPIKGQIWDRFKCKYVWPCDHTDSENINKNLKKEFDDNIAIITELDTIGEIIKKMEGSYTVDEKKLVKVEQGKEELVICRRCGAPIMTFPEISLKICAWCQKNLNENDSKKLAELSLTKVEESSGESGCQLH